jgi:2-oxoglutarate ferredoxin oxidoreductase subunit alpha
MSLRAYNIAIGGEAGQGLATIGELLSKLLVRSGYKIVVTQSYQSRIRGGHNTFYIRTSADLIEAPQEKIDLLLALNDETPALHREKVSADGLIVADEALSISDKRCLKIPYKELSTEQFRNTAAMGVVCAILGLDRDKAIDLLKERFGKKHAEQLKENIEALGKSYEWASEKEVRFVELPPAATEQDAHIMMNGNQAIAMGAVSAGARFCAFYPMTPATTISLTLIGMAERMGLVVEQVEDEISAVNMALGASFTGVPAMVATSGGGFALMVEGISLAGMTETPLVVVVSQRPGPATGLPTRTEQADLEFVLHAGHGEFPRAIFAPGDVEECFYLTRKAFYMAEAFQTPAFVLTDQFLADSYRAIPPFDLKNLDYIQPALTKHKIRSPYLRHAITDSGVSPRLIPGITEHLVITDSDEHTEDGHLTEDLEVRRRLVDKRLRKAEALSNEVMPPDYKGEGRADLLLVSWGSSKGSVREAAGRLKGKGHNVATLHFNQVWPLISDQFLPYLTGAKRVICIEGNACGQLAAIISRETGFRIDERISRYDGLPLTPEYILRELETHSA